MKSLLSTTALVVALGFPGMILAQTAGTDAGTAQVRTDMPGFLAARGKSDIFVSELMGHDVYARRTPGPTNDDMAATDDQAPADTTTTDMTTMTRTDLDGMDNIGQINEVVLSSDGQVRAIVIAVGGFLGMGEQDVAVTMDQVTFAADPEDRAEMYVVVNTGADMLKTSPRYERGAMVTGTGATPDTMAATDDTQGDRAIFVAPAITRDGYNTVPKTEMSSELLVGKSVYGVNDKSVGTIDDLILDDQGAITQVIIDFGGFLGMGTSQVSLGFDELTILADEGRSDVRVYVDATKEQIQAQPQYHATN